jgi:anti-sigma B factor antagonist
MDDSPSSMSTLDPRDGEISSQFRVAVRASTDRTAVLALRGEVDLASAAELRNALTVSIKVGVRHLILDCAELTFLDASGVGALVVASTDLRARGGKLVVRNPSVPVQIVLDAAGLDDLLEATQPRPGRARGFAEEPPMSGSLSV